MHSTIKTSIFALLVPSIVFVLIGCAPVNSSDCRTRWEENVGKLRLPFEHARSTLVFDFTAATIRQSEQIVANGYAGSGKPSLTIVTGGNSSPNFSPSTVPPQLLLGRKKLVIVNGPVGRTNKIVSEACDLEMDGVSLKTINFQPLPAIKALLKSADS